MLFGAARVGQVAAAFFIDGEEAHRGAVFRSHVGDRRAVGEGEADSTCSVELNELTNDLGFAKHFGDGEDEVRCGDAWLERTGEVDTDHIGGEEVNRLSQHPGFGFNPANAPADDSKTIDHRGVGVGSNEGIRVEEAIIGGKNTLCEVFEVYLVDDTNAWWNDAKCVKGLHPPLHELVALCVALEFDFHVAAECFGPLGDIDLYGVVYNEVNRYERLDDASIFTKLVDSAAHRSHVHEEGNAGKVLQDNACDNKWNFIGALSCRSPVCQCVYIGFGHTLAITVAQNRLKHNPD